MTNLCPNCGYAMNPALDCTGGSSYYCPCCRSYWTWETRASADTTPRTMDEWRKETPTSS